MNDNISRRSLIINGGVATAAAVVLAACGGEESGLARIGDAPATTALPEAHVSDLVLLRTAQSVENLAVEALTDATVVAKASSTAKTALSMYVDTHKKNIAALAPLVEAHGGTSVTEPNTKMMANYVTTAVALIADSDQAETDVLAFVHALEGVVAATYQAFVAWTSEPELRSAMMMLAIGPSAHSAATAQLIRSGTEGIVPATDENGVALVATLPGAFGPLSPFQAALGKPNDAGSRTVVGMETPSLNSLEY